MPPLRPLSWRPLAWGALALMLLGTLGAAWAVRSAESARFAQAEQAQVEATTERLDRRMRTLVQILKGASGYLAREGRLPDRQAWREYVAGLEFFRTYPGVQGMGFVQWIPTHARSARVRGEPPPGDGGPPGEPLPADPAGHSVILYLEPLDERNQRALGRDMWAEAIRRAAMARARDTGLPTLSGPVTLFQEGPTAVQVGTLLYTPVYLPGPEPVTVEARRQRFLGWAYHPLRMNDFLEATLAEKQALGRIELVDMTTGVPRGLATMGSAGAAGDGRFERRLEIGGRVWLLRIHFGPAHRATLGEGKALLVLLGGALASLLVFVLLRSEGRLRVREQAAADRTRAELRASETRFRELFDLLPVGVSLIGPDGTILATNRASEALLGVPADDLMRRRFKGPYWEVLRPDGSPMPPEEFASVRAAREQRRIEDVEMGVRRPDGSIVWLQVDAEPSRAEGLGPIVVYTDITHRRRAEAELAASEFRWRSALEATGMGLWDWNLETDEVYFSHQWKAMLGYADDEVGHALSEWDSRVHPDDKAAVYAALEATFRGETPIYENEHRMRTKDGSYLWILDRGVVVAWVEPGRPRRMIGSHSDITLRKRLEESEARALKAEGLVLMAGGIAHDFNNLFQALQSGLDMVELQVPAPVAGAIQAPMARAREALRRAIALSWRMLDFSGRAFVRLVPVDPGELLDAWRADLEAGLGGACRLDVALEPTPRIFADPVQLRRALDALLTNAREAMAARPGGSIRLRLSVAYGTGSAAPGGVWAADPPPGPATVCLEVADEGEGAAPAVLARMFDPFFTTRELGRGLGLASVLGLLKAHHAGVHVQTNAAGGLTFQLHFPPAGA